MKSFAWDWSHKDGWKMKTLVTVMPNLQEFVDRGLPRCGITSGG